MNVLERINRALEVSAATATVTETATVPESHNPYLRDAVIACLPLLSDDQFQRFESEVATKCHYALTSRLTNFAVLVQGIAIMADSPLDADKAMWEGMNLRVRSALCQPGDANTRMTSINVSPANGLHS